MNVIFENGLFLAISTYEEKDIPKGAGFRWNKDDRQWQTSDCKVAEKIIEYCDDIAKEEIKKQLESANKKIEESIKVNSDIDIPIPAGLNLYGYQKAGVEFLSKRNNCLLADEQGTGKTIQIIGLLNYHKDIKKILVVCPATLKLNWNKELNKWLVSKKEITIINGEDDFDADIIIINYDLLKKFEDKLQSIEFDLIVLDESHYIKNSKTIRSKIALKLNGKKKILLTGTPILNRPEELFNQLKFLKNPLAENWFRYMTRYANATQTRWGWDTSGASNLNELQERLRTSVMLRRMKKDVLAELPSKIRQIIELKAEDGKMKEAVEFEKSILKKKKFKDVIQGQFDLGYEENIEKLQKDNFTFFTEMSKARHQTALAKVDKVIEFVKDILESEEKVVIFAHHHDVINNLKEGLKEFFPASLTGDDSIVLRDKSVTAFQENSNVRIFIGNMKAAGVGITLTASSTVVFAELDWTPSIINQAEDRTHRIGQKNSVNVYHVVVNDSIDANLAQMIIDKQKIIEQAVDISKMGNKNKIEDILNISNKVEVK